MKRFLFIVLLTAFSNAAAQDSGKSATETQSDQQVQISILKDSVDLLNQRMADLAREQKRLLRSATKESPVIKNLETAYLGILEKREQIQIKMVRLEAMRGK